MWSKIAREICFVAHVLLNSVTLNEYKRLNCCKVSITSLERYATKDQKIEIVLERSNGEMPATVRLIGTITRWDSNRGFGFLKAEDGNADLQTEEKCRCP
jgi:hypothetical protein